PLASTLRRKLKIKDLTPSLERVVDRLLALHQVGGQGGAAAERGVHLRDERAEIAHRAFGFCAGGVAAQTLLLCAARLCLDTIAEIVPRARVVRRIGEAADARSPCVRRGGCR